MSYVVWLLGLQLLFLLLRPSAATFTPDFYAFLNDTYGQIVADVLERRDLAEYGSFGGRHNRTAEAEGTQARRPVIIVHGVTNMASTFNFVRTHLTKSGYSDEEIFATTYGDAYKKWIVLVHLECQFIRQIRTFISAIYAYNNSSKLDIMAYSMGSPIARKAILGGDCKGTSLGEPLTQMVETFLSVAGANYGSYLCVLPIAICSAEDGLYCTSRMLVNLNTQVRRYEGTHSYAIFSSDDNLVGVDCCGRNCSSLAHSDEEFVVSNYDHDQVMKETLDLQLSLLRRTTNS